METFLKAQKQLRIKIIKALTSRFQNYNTFLNESVNNLVQPVKTAELVYNLPLTDLSAATNI